MKLLITTGIFPPDVGGPATYVPQIAQALLERGHTVTVLTLSDNLDHHHAYPFQVVRLLRTQLKLLRMARTVYTIWRLGKKAQAIFVNGVALEATLANLALGKPLVLKVVGDLAWERAVDRRWSGQTFEAFQAARHGPKIALLKTLRAWWTRRADRVVVPSQYLARWVKEWGVPEARIEVIYNSVARPNGLAASSLPLKSAVRLVTAGRLVPLKRVDGILEAIAGLSDAGLLVIGDGPERERLEHRVSELGIGDRVYFTGERERRDALALMAACDVFVLNSTHEGLPHVILEAMILGLPVVATAVGGTPEIVIDGKTGQLVNARDGSLAETLARVALDLGLRRRLGEQAQTFVQEKLRPELMVERTEALLAAVAR